MSRITTEPNNDPSFGQWLKEHRNALRLSREELADRVGCSPETIYKVEAGTRLPSRQVAQILAGFFGVPAEEHEAFTAFARGQGSGVGESEGVSVSRDAPWRAVHPIATNLPAQVTSLIGRGVEIEEVRALLLSDAARIVTLVGPPGIGKTRLALEVAAQISERFDGGVFFVPLASITDPELVVTTIAELVGARVGANQTVLEALTQSLHGKRALLVLDNFEQILEAAPQVGQLLAGCPQLKVLVTSRELLHMYGEHLYPVPPLEIPPRDEAERTGGNSGFSLSVQDLEQYPSVKLFVDRAQAAKPGFVLDEETADSIARICVRLEGLPLAIELAAARIKLYAPQTMLPVLANALGLLIAGPRDLPPRQRTLRAAIEWSYDLLGDEERRLFRRLSVFSDGCTLVAAEAVCNAEGDLPGGAAMQLESLVDKSLLQVSIQGREAGAEPRFHMLGTIREYALECLEQSGEGELLRRLQAEYYLVKAEALFMENSGPTEAEWIKWLEQEHNNLRAVFTWVTTPSENKAASFVELGLRLGSVLGKWWFMRGHISEGRGWLEKVLAMAERDYAQLTEEMRHKLADVWNYAGSLTGVQGDYASAISMLERSIELSRSLNNKQAVSRTLNTLGYHLWYLGAYTEAESHFKDSLALMRDLVGENDPALAISYLRLGEAAQTKCAYAEATRFYEQSEVLCRAHDKKAWLVDTLVNQGLLAYAQGDLERALELARESLALSREIGYSGGEAITLVVQGTALCSQGVFDAGLPALERSLEFWRAIGEQTTSSFVLMHLGKAVVRMEDYARGRTLLGEALRIGIAIRSYNVVMAECLEWLAFLEVAESSVGGNREGARRAATILGATEAGREVMGAPIEWVNRSHYDQVVHSTRAQLGPTDFGAAWQQGRALSLEEAAALARQPLPPGQPPTPIAGTGQAPISTRGHSDDVLELTERELDVLRLLAQGMTNKEIGECLALSHRTVQTHLYRVFGKLDVTTRSAATRYALERGIV